MGGQHICIRTLLHTSKLVFARKHVYACVFVAVRVRMCTKIECLRSGLVTLLNLTMPLPKLLSTQTGEHSNLSVNVAEYGRAADTSPRLHL